MSESNSQPYPRTTIKHDVAIMIRSANENDADRLTRISFASKNYWDYPPAYFEIWKNELTIGADYIRDNDVFVLETGASAIGYYSIVRLEKDMTVAGITLPKGFWLDHMFIVPAHIGQGWGSQMFDHLKRQCALADIETLCILSDPNAKGFYEKMGCRYLKEYPSTIEGRTTPLLVLTLGDRSAQRL